MSLGRSVSSTVSHAACHTSKACEFLQLCTSLESKYW